MLRIPEQTNASGLACDFCVRSLRAPSSPAVAEGLPREGSGPCFGSAMPHPGPISPLSLARAGPSTTGSLSPGLTAAQKRQGLSVPMGRHSSGVTASPGVPAAPHKTPGFCNNPKRATISLT